jgi:hypothetical protein
MIVQIESRKTALFMVFGVGLLACSADEGLARPQPGSRASPNPGLAAAAGSPALNHTQPSSTAPTLTPPVTPLTPVTPATPPMPGQANGMQPTAAAGGTAAPPPAMIMPVVPTKDPSNPPAQAAPTGEAGAPVVPMIKGDCPKFANGTISFMGLNDINVVTGQKAAGPTAPMVFYWHGTGSFAGEYATMAGAVQQGVAAEGGVLIAFGGTTGGDLLSGTSTFGKGDFDIADQLFACAVRDYNVDPKRVYATGCSAGGLFSGAMAALRSNYMAAVSPNSGGWTVPVTFENKWTPALMTVHGAPGQDVVIVDFSNTSATADKAFQQRGGFVINCNHGGGHCGGGGFAPDVWKFFKAHTYGVSPSPWKDSLPAGFNDKCKIYSGM